MDGRVREGPPVLWESIACRRVGSEAESPGRASERARVAKAREGTRIRKGTLQALRKGATERSLARSHALTSACAAGRRTAGRRGAGPLRLRGTRAVSEGLVGGGPPPAPPPSAARAVKFANGARGERAQPRRCTGSGARCGRPAALLISQERCQAFCWVKMAPEPKARPAGATSSPAAAGECGACACS